MTAGLEELERRVTTLEVEARAWAPVVQIQRDLWEFRIETRNRLDSLEQRMGSLEQRMGSLEQRMGSLEQRMGSLEQKMDEILQLLRSRP